MRTGANGRAAEATGPRGAFLLTLISVFGLLAATAEERTFGTVSDEQQILDTSVSMVEFREIGIAQGQMFMFHRKQGDAVSPFGMGLSLVDTLPSLVAESFEKSLGVGASQTLYVCLQALIITAAAGAAGLLALVLGASTVGMAIAMLGTAVGSPLWAYQSINATEPLQAALLVASVLMATIASSRERTVWRAAAAAGFLAGAAVLAKTANVVVLPLLLVPIVFGGDEPLRSERRRRSIAAWSLSASVALCVWAAFEVPRYGHPLGSHSGQKFTHSTLDGLWRLLVGPNKGLLLYFPLLALSVLGLHSLWRRRGEARAPAIAIAGVFACLLVMAASWWAWDGGFGWGPRLIVPAIPLLAAAAGVAVKGVVRTRVAACLLATGAAVNLLGVLESETATGIYLSGLSLPHGLSMTAPLCPIRVHAFVIGARIAAKDEADLVRRLEAPSFATPRPGSMSLVAHSAPAALMSYLTRRFAWPHLGSAIRPDEAQADAFNTAWANSIADQILRALDIGLPERAMALSERLFELTPSGYTAALRAEALRAAGRHETLALFLSSLQPQMRSSPSLRVVEALRAREAGDEPLARKILGDVAQVFPRPALLEALHKPLPEWPKSLHAMTGSGLSGHFGSP